MTDSKAADIEDKKYFQISEVAKICNIKPHTLRFWEREFEEIDPTTRKGNRRYYTKKDLNLLLLIKSLLYEKKLTLAGAKAYLANKEDSLDSDLVKNIILDLESILEELRS